MTTYVALLRGINVGGHKRVAMADLRRLLTGLGLRDVRSLLQSGNLVFRSDSRAGAALEPVLEAEARQRLALEADVFVRSAAEWQAVVAGNPFPREAERDPGRLLVMFFRKPPAKTALAALQGAVPGSERIRASGRQLYLVYPEGVGRSRLTSTLVEKLLGARGTGRNWNTVRKLAALTEA